MRNMGEWKNVHPWHVKVGDYIIIANVGGPDDGKFAKYEITGVRKLRPGHFSGRNRYEFYLKLTWTSDGQYAANPSSTTFYTDQKVRIHRRNG